MEATRPTPKWLAWFPPAQWLREYRPEFLGRDIVAGVTLAAYAIPVSLAYATLAGLPPQVGVYGYLLGGIGYALFGSSRQLAVGPTSAISLMLAGTVVEMAGGDAVRYGQIASLAGFTVGLLCLLAWALRLSALVKLISDSILVGFKFGAGLTIIMTQLPSLFGVAGGGHNFFERVVLLAGQLGQTNFIVLAIGAVAIALLLMGERWLPGKPVALGVVAVSILAASVLGLSGMGVATTGFIPAGLPSFAGPAKLGRPAGIYPVVATPSADNPMTEAARIASATTTSATGLPGSHRSPSKISAIAINPIATTTRFVWPSWPPNSTTRSKKLCPPPATPNRLGS